MLDTDQYLFAVQCSSKSFRPFGTLFPRITELAKTKIKLVRQNAIAIVFDLYRIEAP